MGSGIGGLTAAAQLAQAGQRVLVVERHDRVGGYAHAFRRGRHLFDSAVHVVGRAGVQSLLEDLGVADQCNWLPVDPFYTVELPGLRLAVPGDPDGFLEAHVAAFPEEEKGIRSFLTECTDIARETDRASRLSSPTEILRHPARFPALLRHRRSTVADVLDHHVQDPTTRAALTSLWPYLGLPPSKLSFLYWSTMLLSYLEAGAVYARGSFQNLAKALAHAVEERGGEILLRSTVRRITVEGDTVRGIVLENGQRIAAPIVVSNADVRQTAFELVGREHLPAGYRRQLRRLQPSISAFIAYLAVERSGLSPASHETFFFEEADHEAAHASALAGTPRWFTATVPTLLDPTLAPEDEHLLILTTLLGADTGPWPERKQELTNGLVEAAAARIPGLRDILRFCEGASPRTMERYTRNDSGAIYGFALTPAQVGPGRPAPTTPLRGLFLAGHWTQPGGGITGVITSGQHCARSILNAK
ncbi:MAG: NAD(P)/FAD-dependent oxidoreductase [bacterium]|nr:NAD(P)/FAD-dependent oxidoreductase [bacterium]